ncbi:MAG: O-antigen ligase family protein [Nostocales cyanobacterium 94392]|nr:O-antigen ligase family protein [Nostocales cyanobacterium 94392]
MNKKYLSIAETLFAIIGLTFFSGGFSVGANLGTNPPLPGIIPPIVLSLIRYFVWIVSTLLIGLRWKHSLAVASKDIWLWILTTLILQSYIWSDFSDMTYLGGREIWQMTSFGLYLASRFSLKEQVQLLAITFGIGALTSAFFALAGPSIGQHSWDHPGAWKGIYDYKNTLGSMMVIGSLSYFLLPIQNLKTPIRKKIGLLLKLTGIAISLAIVLLSTSKTSLIVYFLLVGILIFYGKYRWQGKLTVIYLDITVLFLGCFGTVILTNWINILTNLGKDYTMSGRTLMWEVMLMRIEDRPWLGYGRGAFWMKGTKYPIEVGNAVTSSFIAPHGHNGFLDLVLDIGLIGLVLFLISFTIAFFRSLKRAYAVESSPDLWPLAFLLFLAMNNMMESYLLRLANIYWVLYIAVALSVDKGKSVRELNYIKEVDNLKKYQKEKVPI